MQASSRQMELRQRFKALLRDLLLQSVEERRAISSSEFDEHVRQIEKDLQTGDYFVSAIISGLSEDYFDWYARDPEVLQDFMRAYLGVCIDYLDRGDLHYPPDFDDALDRATPVDAKTLLAQAKSRGARSGGH